MKGKKKQRTGLVAGIFVGLKILEAVAVLVLVFGFYYLGKFFCSLDYCFGTGSFAIWITGLFVFVTGGLVLVLVIAIIVTIIQENWNLAKKLSKKV